MKKVQEEKYLNSNYPSLNDTLKLAINKKRLWDRRKSDSDFLKIRIGYGDFPILARNKISAKEISN